MRMQNFLGRAVLRDCRWIVRLFEGHGQAMYTGKRVSAVMQASARRCRAKRQLLPLPMSVVDRLVLPYHASLAALRSGSQYEAAVRMMRQLLVFSCSLDHMGVRELDTQVRANAVAAVNAAIAVGESTGCWRMEGWVLDWCEAFVVWVDRRLQTMPAGRVLRGLS